VKFSGSSGASELKPELSLLLACARTGSAQEKQAAIQQLLADGIDWTSFAQTAIAHGFATFAAHSLARLAPDSIPTDILDAFHALMDETSKANRARFEELTRLVDALAKNRIDAIPFKGPLLAIQAFGDLGLREFRDLDFLVRDDDLAKTVAILNSLGYQRNGELSAAQFALIHRLQGQEIIFGESSRTAVEPHTRVTSLKMALDIDYAGLWRRAQRTSLNGHKFLTPAPEDGLLLLAIHGGKEMWRKLKWACDLAGFVQSFPDLDWDAVAERARAQGCLRMLLLATSLGRKYFNASIPDAIIAAERGDPAIEPMVHRIVEQWQAGGPGLLRGGKSVDPGERLVDMDWLRLHDGIVRQARYVARTLFLPGPEYVASIALPGHLGFAYIPIKLAHDLMALPLWQALRQALAPVGRLPYAFAGSEAALAVIPASSETKQTIRQYRRARAYAKRTLARAPNDPAALRDLGDALVGLRRHRDAIACYDKALEYAPHDTTIWKKRLTAVRATGVAIDLPDLPHDLQDARAWAIYAAQLFSSRRYAQAIEAADRSIALDPDSIAGARAGIQSRLWACDWSRREADERRVSEGVKAGWPIMTPFFHRAISDSEAESLALARLWTRGMRPAEALWRGEGYAHDKIRVAYSSTDFRDHVLSDAIAGCFEHHDRSRFETTAVSLGPGDGSVMRQRLTAAFDRFIDVQAISDFEVAKLLRALEIDIVVDLNGNSGDCRTGIFAQRPAPVQVSFLGYPGTMALPFFEYIIADPVVIPDVHRIHYAEHIVYMPHTYMPNDRMRQILARAPNRIDAGLPTTGFVFACHNSEYKITPEIFDIWMRLLRTVDGSVLWLKSPNPSAIVNLRREANTRGVAPERLVFAPRLSQAKDHLARLQLADLFLDTRPYNAHATACDALWVGVPVVTCLGNTFPGRVAASVLHAIGLPELVTSSLAEYEGLAAGLALDRDRLATIKVKLMRNRGTEPLFDTARFTRDLEAAYTIMCKRQQDGLPAASFAVNCTPAYAA
jgi:protein O-GlcNAc transferase